jgi:hypothetical protein
MVVLSADGPGRAHVEHNDFISGSHVSASFPGRVLLLRIVDSSIGTSGDFVNRELWLRQQGRAPGRIGDSGGRLLLFGAPP